MDKEKAIRTLSRYLRAWMQGDYLKMYRLTQPTWKSEHTERDIRTLYECRRLTSNELKAVAGSGTAAVKIRICSYVNNRPTETEAMLVCENGAYAPSPCGVWGVNPISVL